MSYSQHYEDYFIYKQIQESKIKIPSYIVEIGAWTGYKNSNSRMYLEMGWKGLLIEPSVENFKQLKKSTKGFNVELVNCAISDKKEIVKFTYFEDKPSHSCISDKGYEVQTYRLKDLVKEQIGILSVDAEGYDTRIIKDIISSGLRPKFIIIEANNEQEESRQAVILRPYYKFLKKRKVNTIWSLKQT